MKNINQSQIFLLNEGDKYFLRNIEQNKKKNFSNDILTSLVKNKIKRRKNYRVLEIGCSSGHRLKFLKDKYNKNFYFGIDPSALAINFIKRNFKTIKAYQQTANSIKFKKESFDIVILGFCLYLCDDKDLFKISSEVFRILKKKGNIFIEDFIIKKPKYVPYKHKKGIFCRKMNYIAMFSWHPRIKLLRKKTYLTPKNNLNKVNRTVTVAELQKI